MKQYILSENAGQAILNYLAQRPYAEVFQLIRVLETLAEAPVPQGSEPVKE